jgi:hypothetical protein
MGMDALSGGHGDFDSWEKIPIVNSAALYVYQFERACIVV